jgi:hypothetical protein
MSGPLGTGKKCRSQERVWMITWRNTSLPPCSVSSITSTSSSETCGEARGRWREQRRKREERVRGWQERRQSKLWTKCDSDLISHGQWATRDYAACLQPRGHHYRAIVLHPNRFRHCPLTHDCEEISLYDNSVITV